MNGKWVKNPKANNNAKNVWEAAGEDWACIHCDTLALATYQGNYASDDNCRECHRGKGIRHHMTMAKRSWRLSNGTLNNREEMIALRKERKHKQNHPNQDDNYPEPTNHQAGG